MRLQNLYFLILTYLDIAKLQGNCGKKTNVRYLERKIARTQTPFDTMKTIFLANQSHRNRLKMKVSNS